MATVDINVTAINDFPYIRYPAGTNDILAKEDRPVVVQGTKFARVEVKDKDIHVFDGRLVTLLSTKHGTLTLYQREADFVMSCPAAEETFEQKACGSYDVGCIANNTALGLCAATALREKSYVIIGRQRATNKVLKSFIYRPDEDFFGNDTLYIEVSDGGLTGAGGVGTANGSLGIVVAPVNDAPEVVYEPENAFKTEYRVPQDEDFFVADYARLSITDVDTERGPPDQEVFVHFQVQHGTLTLHNSEGFTPAAKDDYGLAFPIENAGFINTRSIIAKASYDNINRALRNITVHPDPYYSGLVSFYVSVLDREYYGSGGPKGVSGGLKIRYLPVPDPVELEAIPGRLNVRGHPDKDGRRRLPLVTLSAFIRLKDTDGSERVVVYIAGIPNKVDLYVGGLLLSNKKWLLLEEGIAECAATNYSAGENCIRLSDRMMIIDGDLYAFPIGERRDLQLAVNDDCTVFHEGCVPCYPGSTFNCSVLAVEGFSVNITASTIERGTGDKAIVTDRLIILPSLRVTSRRLLASGEEVAIDTAEMDTSPMGPLARQFASLREASALDTEDTSQDGLESRHGRRLLQQATGFAPELTLIPSSHSVEEDHSVIIEDPIEIIPGSEGDGLAVVVSATSGIIAFIGDMSGLQNLTGNSTATLKLEGNYTALNAALVNNSLVYTPNAVSILYSCKLVVAQLMYCG